MGNYDPEYPNRFRSAENCVPKYISGFEKVQKSAVAPISMPAAPTPIAVTANIYDLSVASLTS